MRIAGRMAIGLATVPVCASPIFVIFSGGPIFGPWSQAATASNAIATAAAERK
jgi:hypothetical protein